jgi:hypothetical protein
MQDTPEEAKVKTGPPTPTQPSAPAPAPAPKTNDLSKDQVVAPTVSPTGSPPGSRPTATPDFKGPQTKNLSGPGFWLNSKKADWDPRTMERTAHLAIVRGFSDTLDEKPGLNPSLVALLSSLVPR